MTEDTQGRSFLKAFVFFSAGCFLTVLTVGSFIADQDAYEAGRIVGRLVAAALFPAIFVGVLSSRSKREFGWLKFGLVYLACFVGCSAMQAVGTIPNAAVGQPISQSEGAAPELVGTTVCQDGVPFHFDLGSADFGLVPELGQSDPTMRLWVWEHGDSGERVLASISKAGTESPHGFAEFVRGVQSSVVEPFELSYEAVRTETIPYVADFGFTSTTGVSFDTRCMSNGDSDRVSWAVCVSTTSLDPAALQKIRESLVLSGCRGMRFEAQGTGSAVGHFQVASSP